MPTSTEEGVHDAHIIFSEYIADYLTDGKPFNAFAKAKALFGIQTGSVDNRFLAGAEWNYSKNFGKGQVYDLYKPLSVSGWGARPRAYSSIPGIQNFRHFWNTTPPPLSATTDWNFKPASVRPRCSDLTAAMKCRGKSILTRAPV